MLTETFMKDNGETIRLTVKEFISTLMELNTTETGRKISKTEKELKHGLMVLSTMETM